jgi:hypothetical protein
MIKICSQKATGQTGGVAAGLLKSRENFNIVFFLHLMHQFFSTTNVLYKSLQDAE